MSKVATRTSAAKTAFDALIDSNWAWFDWIDHANHFQSILKNRIPWNQLHADEKTAVQQRLKTAAPEKQLLLNSFYVTLVAGFEEFLRASIRELTAQIADGKPKFDDISDVLRRMNIRESAKLLRRMDDPPDYFHFNEEDLCRGIGSCVPGSKAIELNSHALSEVESLIKMQNFIDRVTALGKKISWDELAKQPGVKAAMKMPKEHAREVSKSIESRLKLIARYRNRIAHTGGHAADVTFEILSDDSAVLRSLAEAIHSLP